MSAVFSAAFFLSVNGLSILPDALTRLDGPLGPTALDLFVPHTRKERSLPLVSALEGFRNPCNIAYKMQIDYPDWG